MVQAMNVNVENVEMGMKKLGLLHHPFLVARCFFLGLPVGKIFFIVRVGIAAVGFKIKPVRNPTEIGISQSK